MSNKLLRGVIHGRIIELHEDAEVPDGQEVDVWLYPARPDGGLPGEGFLRTEGALADDSEWDDIMAEIQQSRHHERRSQWEGE